MYQFKEPCNLTQFFWWDKKVIENMNWALLPKSSKAIFPVIACHANIKGEAFPSEQTIAILAGLSDKIVREGITGLEAFPNFKCVYYLSRRGKRAKKFFINIPSSNNGNDIFPFYKFILESVHPPAPRIWWSFYDILGFSILISMQIWKALKFTKLILRKFSRTENMIFVKLILVFWLNLQASTETQLMPR